ncbi:MAG: HD-GYP domain-containing protein [Betaproteobacteria bacterium]
MTAPPPRTQLADELLRRLASALRAAQLYSKHHPLIGRNVEALNAAIQLLHTMQPVTVVGLVEGEVIVDDVPVAQADALGPLVRRLTRGGIERITIERGVTREELAAFVAAVSALEAQGGAREAFPPLPHIRVGRIAVESRPEPANADMAAMQRLYSEAVSAATAVWESSGTEGQPDVSVARTTIDGLAQAVAENRTALLALTTLKNYDNYTFTHMVNVSILTMGQARGLGIDGPLLREFGLAALMHDIGKVRMPLEILNKPEKLSEMEVEIMRRHPVDGAEILRCTPDVPTLAPIVSFEHHLRMDGSGYPFGVIRRTLNLGTMLCSIADVYDAMRSQRRYQQAFPTERILAVLQRNDAQHFDQNLVRRFVQLIGIYPAGNLVRLDSGHIAVVIKVYAPDPYRPQVRVVADGGGVRLERPYELNLWQATPGSGAPSEIVAPLDPAEYDIDPLALL